MKTKKLPTVESFRTIDDDEREELIRSFLPLVKRVVHRLAGRLPAEVDIKEMLNSGIIGLVDALEKYDPRHETNFSTYAQFRIRGTILDSFRIQDWVPRSLRHKAHKLENTYLRLEQDLGRPAEDAEVAKELGVDLETLHKMLGEVTGVVMLSLEELGFGHGEERFRADESLPSSRPDPLHQLLDGERVEIVARTPEEADFGALVPHAVRTAIAERGPVHRQAVEQAAARRVAVDRQRAAADRARLTGDGIAHLVRTKLALVEP